jgi:hypothetical protein
MGEPQPVRLSFAREAGFLARGTAHASINFLVLYQLRRHVGTTFSDCLAPDRRQ